MADASTSSAPAPQEEPHPYTLETLKQHSTREDLWLLINGKVYDVTKFMDEVSLAEAGTARAVGMWSAARMISTSEGPSSLTTSTPVETRS